MASEKAFVGGVYCPLITPFTAVEEVDFPALKRLVLKLAKANMGIVLLGTNGEASHLSTEERQAVIKAGREALDQNGFKDRIIIAGTGTGSTKETIKLCVDAKKAGADFALVIAPGYFNFALSSNKRATVKFFIDVMNNSPLPVMIYNFPGAASGLDLDSDLLIELSEHPNCFGCKLTCAGIAKGHRIALHTQSKAYMSRHPRPYFVFPGYSDYLLPAVFARAFGCITGTANVYPKSLARLWELCLAASTSGSTQAMAEAQSLQDIITEADWVLVKAGIGGMKEVLNQIDNGLGGIPRGPLPISDNGHDLIQDTALAKMLAYEASL